MYHFYQPAQRLTAFLGSSWVPRHPRLGVARNGLYLSGLDSQGMDDPSPGLSSRRDRDLTGSLSCRDR